jgi:hypothetical protein
MTVNTMLTNLASDRVEAFDASTVTGERLVKSIIANGGVIIRNFLDIDTVKTIEQDVRPYIDADKPWSGSSFQRKLVASPDSPASQLPSWILL